MILAIGIMVVLFIWLLFKPELIIDKLKLEQGFEGDRIPFERLDGLAILKLGSIIVGGLLFLRQIPPFFTDSYMLLKSSVKETTVDYLFGVNPIQTKIDFAANILNLLIGYLLVTNYDKVGRLLLPKKED